MKRYGNIVGWGKYVPARVITNAELEKTLDTSDEWIVIMQPFQGRAEPHSARRLRARL